MKNSDFVQCEENHEGLEAAGALHSKALKIVRVGSSYCFSIKAPVLSKSLLFLDHTRIARIQPYC